MLQLKEDYKTNILDKKQKWVIFLINILFLN